ncbi:MAG TPA: class II fructose-bisphosphate aldolase [Chryseolinea sp.]|nr:class II fructose-bisphosphate aldolase [Chryseolinea sp.]
MLVSPKVLFEKCYGKYGIAAINVFTMEQVHGVFSAATKAKSPFIIQTTPVARNYAQVPMLLAMIEAASRIYPQTVFSLHLDHGVEEHVFDAIEKGGYTSVMIDASHDPFDKNVERTKAVVEKAHAKGMVVEAELGVLSGVEDDLTVEDRNALYTQPDEVVEFVSKTKCDSLAVAVGTSHGAYKFSGGRGLQLDIMASIQNKLPQFPLVLHGGSSVSQDEVKRVNAAGGKLKPDAKGVSAGELRKAINLGVCKINIATDCRILWARTHREFFRDSPDGFDPIIPGKLYMQELEKALIEKFELFGSAGKA